MKLGWWTWVTLIGDAVPQLTDPEITRYTLLCSGSLAGQVQPRTTASIDIGGPLETSVCTFRCQEMVTNPDAHWQTLEELVHEVAIHSGTECNMRVTPHSRSGLSILPSPGYRNLRSRSHRWTLPTNRPRVLYQSRARDARTIH
eukprot:Protomagalhaensia_wolfi_Nauph_80__903@NODE_151_length_3407_cov_19_594121_g112_i0_p6_GENE_NODE_151_length_3407_cov_19_594121_g112_i0NODE_151_length_3407_cov_19_594121_g112_i0_p6_ORF_typecomplete_len144_score8_37_NODE_151_length_3407_cov_19_594121_g112_i0409840